MRAIARGLAVILLACWASLALRLPAQDETVTVQPLSAAENEAALARSPLAGTPQEGYRLYPGDLVRFSVFDHPDLTASIRVPTQGPVSFPLVGDLDHVVGQPLEEFTARLKTLLEDGYVRQAVITATVLDYGPRRAYVMGSVQRPTAIELNPYAPISALQAIGQAGGFLEDANRNAALVIRDDPAHPGRKIALALPAEDRPEAITADVQLQPFDLVIVPRLDRVYIIGQVRRPGALNLPGQEALTVSKAISLAGGFDRFARQTDVQLIRSGEPVQTVDTRALLRGDGGSDPQLKPGDTVFVPESRF